MIKDKLSFATKKSNVDDVMGKSGIVIKEISREKAGQVKIGPEVWRATADMTIAKNGKVKVIDVEGVTLKVVELK